MKNFITLHDSDEGMPVLVRASQITHVEFPKSGVVIHLVGGELFHPSEDSMQVLRAIEESQL